MVFTMWTLLGRRLDIAREATTLGICCKNGRLALKREHRDSPGIVDRVYSSLMSVHHLIVQNDGRWTTHGVSGQLLAGSFFAGLTEATRNATEDEGQSYNLGPFTRRNTASLRTRDGAFHWRSLASALSMSYFSSSQCSFAALVSILQS